MDTREAKATLRRVRDLFAIKRAELQPLLRRERLGEPTEKQRKEWDEQAEKLTAQFEGLEKERQVLVAKLKKLYLRANKLRAKMPVTGKFETYWAGREGGFEITRNSLVKDRGKVLSAEERLRALREYESMLNLQLSVPAKFVRFSVDDFLRAVEERLKGA